MKWIFRDYEPTKTLLSDPLLLLESAHSVHCVSVQAHVHVFVFIFKCKEWLWNIHTQKNTDWQCKTFCSGEGPLSEWSHAPLPYMAGLLLWWWVDISLIKSCCYAPVRGIQTSTQTSCPPLNFSILRAKLRGVELHFNILNHFHQWCGIQSRAWTLLPHELFPWGTFTIHINILIPNSLVEITTQQPFAEKPLKMSVICVTHALTH